MISRSPRCTGVALVILPEPRRIRIDGRRFFKALLRRRRGRGRSMRKCPSVRTVRASWQRNWRATAARRAPRSRPAIRRAPRRARDVTKSGSVSDGSLCSRTTASRSASPPSPGTSCNDDAVERRHRHVERHVHAGQRAPQHHAFAMKLDIAAPAHRRRHRSPRNRTGRPNGSSRSARLDPAGHPPLRI